MRVTGEETKYWWGKPVIVPLHLLQFLRNLARDRSRISTEKHRCLTPEPWHDQEEVFEKYATNRKIYQLKVVVFIRHPIIYNTKRSI
jgi:hypothetical protein